MDMYFTVVLGCVLLFSSSTLGDLQTDILNDSNVGGHTKKVNLEEGQPLSVSCHDSEASWTGPNGFRSSNEWLNISRVSTSDTGKYKCSSEALGNLLTIDLDVLTPPTIVSITVPRRVFGMREDFLMTVEVKGNPPPETTLTHLPDGKVVFKKKGVGNHTITVNNLNCTDGGIYELTCNNTVGEKQVNESITVINKPALDPMFLPDQRISPRLGEAANFTAHIISCPPVLFMEWTHNSKPVKNHNDTDNSTELFIEDVGVADYGDYELLLRNNVGNVSIPFLVEAFGPPAPVSDIEVSGVTDKSANISFMSGFDYNDTQTFMVMREVDGQLKSLVNVTDKPNDTGIPTSFVIECLDETTSYSITIISRTSRGNSPPAATYGNFTTYGSPKPDPKFPIDHTTTPRLGDSASFTIHCLSDPEPSFLWLHDGKQVKGLDSNMTCGSTIMVEKVKVADFGAYMLEMWNDYGEYNVSYEMLATGPPAPVTDLKITNISTTTATIMFTTGYNYNNTQTFIVEQKSGSKVITLTECNDTTDGKGGVELSCDLDGLKYFTMYQVTVASQNSAGKSIPTTGFIEFTTYGAPKPDPKFPITNKYKPRTSDTVKLTIHAIGEPVPTFQWEHGNTVFNSTDKGYMSTLELKGVKVEEFGNYTVTMTNEVGNHTTEFVLIPDGPPDSVTDLGTTNITTTSVTLTFKTGYDYGKKQIFTVMHNEDGKPEVLEVCNDTTTGKGGDIFSCKLDKLNQDTLYNVTVISENSEGESNATADTIQFTTYGAPKPDPKYPVNDKFKPRLGQKVNLTVHAIGYPVPKYEWMHDGKPVKSIDTDYSSTVDFEDMTVDEFGNYTVKITNPAGSYVTEYEIIADGPPSPATNLAFTNLTKDSVTLQWMAGFNYGHKQDFRVMQEVENGVDTELVDVDDVTDGRGGKMESTSLKGLKAGTAYSVYLVAENTKGNATQSNKVTFTTTANDDSGLSAAGVAGIVIGVLAVIVLAVVIGVVIKRRKSSYEQFDEQRPNRYSYDERP